MDTQHIVHNTIDSLEDKYDPENDAYFTATDYCLLQIIKQLQNQIEELAARIYILEHKKEK